MYRIILVLVCGILCYQNTAEMIKKQAIRNMVRDAATMPPDTQSRGIQTARIRTSCATAALGGRIGHLSRAGSHSEKSQQTALSRMARIKKYKTNPETHRFRYEEEDENG